MELISTSATIYQSTRDTPSTPRIKFYRNKEIAAILAKEEAYIAARNNTDCPASFTHFLL
jgi:hypothetical protein